MKIFPNLSREIRRDLIAYLKLVSPFLFLVAIAIHFEEFVVHAIKSGFIINMSIILIATYGAVIIVLRMRSAQVDFRVIERFGREANSGKKMSDILQEPWLQGVYVRHYLAHIANTGGTLHSQIDQNAIENELHALQAEYNNRLEFPQFIAGFMVAMGLLGTFIGLLETLTGISGMLDGMGAPGTNVEQQFGELVVKLRNPLAGMGIAFSASMFGLITSLMLAVMMINLRRYIGRVIALARNVMHDLTVIASHNSPTAQVTQNTRSEAGLASSISNTTIAGRFDLLTRKIEAVLEAFESSINTTQRMVDLMGFGPRMREISEKTLDEIKLMSTKTGDTQLLLKNLLDTTAESIKIGNNLIEQNQVNKETNLEALQTLKNLAASDLFFSQRRDQEFRDRILMDIKGLSTVQSDNKKLIQSLIDLGGNNIRNIEALINTQRETKSELGNLVGRLIESMQKVEEVDIGSARHLYDIKERLNKLLNNFGMVDMIASGISGQTVLLEELVEETRITRTGSRTEVDNNYAEQNYTDIDNNENNGF